MLQDASDEVRGEASRYLVERQGSHALESLRALLEEEDVHWVRTLVEEQVRRLQEPTDQRILN